MPAHRGPVGVSLTVLLLATTAACQYPGSSPRPGPSAPAGDGRGFTLVASGDVLPHMSIIERARTDAGGDGYDFAPMLAGVKPVVSEADLAICHMETVYGADGNYSGYPVFKSPPEVAAGLAATGYDACSTASNHSLDDGARGIQRTLDALDRAGVRHAGSARTAEEARRPTLMRAGGAQVAHLAYTYGTNDIPLPVDRPWAVNLIDRERILTDARAARRAGADVVVVSLHWGTEWQDAPDAQQVTLAEELTRAATGGRPVVDLILGTHAHVPQAYEKVNGTWVVYGMGDQVAGAMKNHSGAFDPRGNQGTLARFTFAPPARDGDRWAVTRAEFVPQWFDTGRGRVVDLDSAIAAGAGADVAAVRDRIRDVVLSRGAAQDGLVTGN
ncbi:MULTISPECIES: CapA family protein [Streptomyces]|uniref:Lipoprotein n=1 Tax=Streptomyces bottropensis ATCC 25435 TaxID=1054862 RepID=M3FJ51_9ACTN|nr:MULTISPECIES: CapA family protein [Streptomyces]EMF52074.1 lipoprotein [Streptomyces bottropensis ATCC 25435]MZD22510.1 CapA family protein [Streptomyces sp. SID5476]